MTCVVAMVRDGHVFMGADSAAVGGYTIRYRKDPKVFINGEMLIGFTTSFRFGQILQYEFSPPKHHSDVSIEKYMVKTVVPAMRDALKTHGYTKVESNNERGGQCLIGYRGRLFMLDNDFQIAETDDGFDAVGCGHDLAMGSMHSTLAINPSFPANSHIELALLAAARYSAGVTAPFVYLNTGGIGENSKKEVISQ